MPGRAWTTSHRQTTRWITWGALAVLALVSPGACTAPRKVSLPTTSAPAAPSASSTSPRGAVQEAYSRYWVVLVEAEHAPNAGQRRSILAQGAAEPLLSDVLSNIDRMHAKGVTSAGHVITHIEKTKITGADAQVWDCQDATHARLKNISTGRATSRGTAHDHLRADLIQEGDGQWRLTKVVPLDSRC